jgi:hypothetical protein
VTEAEPSPVSTGNELYGTLTGTPAQVEWAERIRMSVAQEFDRVAKILRAQGVIQSGQKQAETQIILAILEQKRAETLTNPTAGYFIRDWQELSDQVRRMIAKDPWYQVIKDQRAAIRRAMVA